MLKFKNISCILLLFLFVTNTQAQYLWYENETATEAIKFTNSSHGTFTNDTNPDITGENTNTICAKFVRKASVSRGFTYFELENPIETAIEYTVSLKGYIAIQQDELSASPKRLRLYLKNTTTGDVKYKQINFTRGQEWENFSFIFDINDFTTSGLGSGGYNQMYIGYGNGKSSEEEITYFVDQIYGTTDQTSLITNTTPISLQGSWGARLIIRGGGTLDEYVKAVSDGGKGYDYVAGAQEMINSYPTMGHIITNATNNAKSYLWTLRTNENVAAVMGTSGAVIDEEFVPSLANEQVIMEVIQEFKQANKKVILYLNGMSPANRASPTGAQSWNDYVARYFSNNEHLAWMNFCEGYLKRFEKLGVDGYWIDAFNSYPGNDRERAEFIQMIRDVDPDVMIAANYDKDYFRDDNGDYLLVDSDGVGDTDERDYKIVKLTATNPWSDMTGGHITPLGQGAPPNSWAYEEFTVPDIQASPTTSYDGSKQALKHLFLPIRSTWSSERSDLMFGEAQAYRFVKNITDGGGAVTFSTTTDKDGTTMEDEETVLKYVDQQLAANATASAYVRPLGAFLVGEEQEEEKLYPWYENEAETPTDYITLESTRQGTITEDFANPFPTGGNTSNTVTKFVRSGGKQARVYFNLPNSITDLSALKIALDAFIEKDNPSKVDYKIRVFLLNTTLNTRVYKQISISSPKTWENLVFDFSDQGSYPDGYDQMAIGFANGDASGGTTTYYVDNIKGSIDQELTSTNRVSSMPSISSTVTPESPVVADYAPLKIYPNPVTNSFNMSNEFSAAIIYSITGEKLLTFSGNQNSFDVSTLNAGLYLIKAFDKKGNSGVVKFIKK